MPQEIKLINSNKTILVDDEDYSKIWCRGNWVEQKTDTGVTIISSTRPHIYLAKFIMGNNKKYDHKDRNPYNNQKNNLREATVSQNLINREKYSIDTCSSKFKGVTFNKANKQWHARISKNGKRIHLGFFESEERAASRYNAAAIKLHQDFAVLNIFE
jgi:hypothetical protein